jgi:predicted Rossmann-fold nucleotide-binding protein
MNINANNTFGKTKLALVQTTTTKKQPVFSGSIAALTTKQTIKSDSVHFGNVAPKPTDTVDVDHPDVAQLLNLAKSKLDQANPFSANSVANRIYQQAFPRERGIIVYGSSRTKPDTAEYNYVVEVGKALGQLQLADKQAHIVTGGGPGAMHAVAKGAQEVGAHAMGAAMNFIGETPSTDVHPEFVVHPNFSERIDGDGGYEARGAYTCAVPGGPGTMQEIWKKANELFYDQTKFPSQKLIVLFDHENYFSAPGGFMENLRFMIARGKANPKMIDLFKLAKTPAEGAQMFLDKTIPWTQPGTPQPAPGH